MTRLEPNREALLVLAPILSIMLTDLAFDGFRFARLAGGGVPGAVDIALERDCAYAGAAVARTFGGLAPAVLCDGFPLTYRVQVWVMFSFLVLWPAGEHFPRGQKIACAFVTILKQADARFGILRSGAGSTGECVRRVGNERLFPQLATALVATLDGLGVKRIVACDPHAMKWLRNEYPEVGGLYGLAHPTQLLGGVHRTGLPWHLRRPAMLSRQHGFPPRLESVD